MQIERFTVKAQEDLQEAQSLARQLGHPEIRDVHLLSALLSQADGIVPPTLRKIGADPIALAAAARRAVDRIASVSGGAQDPRLSPKLAETLESAERIAQEFKDDYTSTEHMLLALARG